MPSASAQLSSELRERPAPCAPKFDDCTTAADEDCDGKTPACTGTERWMKQWAGRGDQRVTSIAHGGGQHWVAAIYQYETRLSDSTTVVSGDKPEYLDASAFEPHESLIARVDEAGTPSEVFRIGGPGDQIIYDLAVASSGDLFAVGTLTKSLSVGGKPLTEGRRFMNESGYVVALSPNGTPRWFDATGGSDYAAAYTTIAVSESSVWIGGYRSTTSTSQLVLRRTNLEGKQEFAWTPDYPGASSFLAEVVVDPAGGVVLLGARERPLQMDKKDVLPLKPNTRGFLLGLGDDGKVRWAKDLADLFPQHAVFSPSGELWITGVFGSKLQVGADALDPKDGDGIVARLDQQHELATARQFTGRSMSSRSSGVYFKYARWFSEAWANGTLVDVDGAGNVTLLCGFAKTFRWQGVETKSDHLRDAMLIKLSASGQPIYQQLVSGPGQLPHALAVDSHGDAWIGGIQVDKAEAFLARQAP